MPLVTETQKTLKFQAADQKAALETALKLIHEGYVIHSASTIGNTFTLRLAEAKSPK